MCPCASSFLLLSQVNEHHTFLSALCFGAITAHVGHIYKLLLTPASDRKLLTK